jgi:hypothetical protein
MAFIRIVQPPNVTADVYDKVNAELGVESSPAPGLLLHCAGEVDGKWQIVDIWESREQARSFYEGPLPAAIEAVVGMPPQDPPVSIEYELHTLIRP